MINFEKIIKIFDRLLLRSADAIFPPSIYCISCGKPITIQSCYSLCDDCLNTLHWANEKTCIQCGKALENWYPDIICAECKNKKHDFNYGITCLQYCDNERSIIHDLKYHKKSYLARIFADMFYDKIKASEQTDKWDIIVPVPMFEKKERVRGYNQAELIARFLSLKIGIFYAPDILLRVKNTAPMNRLGNEERYSNLEEAFSISDDKRVFIDGKRVLLVDDIYTTGATADTCSKV